MLSISKASVGKKLGELREGLKHAFAVKPDDQPLSPEDVQLLERVADAIVKRGMAAPATLFLESMGPMNFLGSQALHFLTPILEMAFNTKEVEQVARLLEQRETIPRLIAFIEERSAPKGASPR